LKQHTLRSFVFHRVRKTDQNQRTTRISMSGDLKGIAVNDSKNELDLLSSLIKESKQLHQKYVNLMKTDTKEAIKLPNDSTHESKIKTSLVSLVSTIQNQFNHDELLAFIHRYPQLLSKYMDCFVMMWDCENALRKTLNEMKRNMDLITSHTYEIQLLYGYRTTITAVVRKYDKQVDGAKLWSQFQLLRNQLMANLGEISEYIMFLVNEIYIQWQTLTNMTQVYDLSSCSDIRLGGRRKRRKFLSVKREIIKGKKGKAIVNRWRKINKNKSWTIGFTRRELLNPYIKNGGVGGVGGVGLGLMKDVFNN
jgi:hypothetical protein